MQAVLEVRVIPVNGSALAQLLAAAGVPMLAVLATQMPLIEIGKWIVGVVL